MEFRRITLITLFLFILGSGHCCGGAKGKRITDSQIIEIAIKGNWKMQQSNSLRGNYYWNFENGNLVLTEEIGPEARLPRDFKGSYKIEDGRVSVTVDGKYREAGFQFETNKLIHAASGTVLVKQKEENNDIN